MQFSFSDEQVELRETLRRALERHCTPEDLSEIASATVRSRSGSSELAASRDVGRSRERWTMLARIGATGLLVPEDGAGLGPCELDFAVVMEEAGRCALPEPLCESAGLAAPLLRSIIGVAPETRDLAALLAEIANGTTIASVGGVDVSEDGLVATSSVITDGSRRTIVTPRVPGAHISDVFIVAIQERSGDLRARSSTHGWEIHLVSSRSVKLITTPSIDPTRDLAMLEWSPGKDTLLVSKEAAHTALLEHSQRTALFNAAQLVGLCDHMIEMTAQHARQRHQFGKPIGSFQAVKHHLANAKVKLEFARPPLYRAACSIATGSPDRAEHVSMAKAIASDAAELASRTALQLHGAIGYTWDYPLHYWMKRTWVLSAAGGDAIIHRALVLKAVTTRLAAEQHLRMKEI